MAERAMAIRAGDPLGVERALGDRLLPLLVAAMTFLAALALAAALAAQTWSTRWQSGAGSTLTAQVPDPGQTLPSGGSRLDRAMTILRASPHVVDARPLTEAELQAVLKPWLGDQAAEAVPSLPAVVSVRGAPDLNESDTLKRLGDALADAVPGAMLEDHQIWVGRLSGLLRAVEACGWGALALVGTVAMLVVAVTTRAGLLARRSTVNILHGLGATDAYVAGRFAQRAALLAVIGGAGGVLLATPILLMLVHLAQSVVAPAQPQPVGLPGPLWVGLAAAPLVACLIGYVTAQATVRRHLARLP